MPRAACSPARSPSGSGRGGQPRKGGAPRAAGRLALEEPQEQKETATAPPWSKQPELAEAQGRAAASEPSALTLSLPPLLPCAWPRAIRLARRAVD